MTLLLLTFTSKFPTFTDTENIFVHVKWIYDYTIDSLVLLFCIPYRWCHRKVFGGVQLDSHGHYCWVCDVNSLQKRSTHSEYILSIVISYIIFHFVSTYWSALFKSEKRKAYEITYNLLFLNSYLYKVPRIHVGFYRGTQNAWRILRLRWSVVGGKEPQEQDTGRKGNLKQKQR